MRRRIRAIGEAVGDDLSPVIYLVCTRAILLASFISFSDSSDSFFHVFGHNTLIHSIGWASVAISAASLAVVGTLLKRGAVVSSMCMTLFVLWLYLVVLYLYNGQIAYALVESTTLLLFAYLYVSVSINRIWGWVPRYARCPEDEVDTPR